MNVNDRLALELGRALLRAVAAEERVAQLEDVIGKQEKPDVVAQDSPKP